MLKHRLHKFTPCQLRTGKKNAGRTAWQSLHLSGTTQYINALMGFNSGHLRHKPSIGEIPTFPRKGSDELPHAPFHACRCAGCLLGRGLLYTFEDASGSWGHLLSSPVLEAVPGYLRVSWAQVPVIVESSPRVHPPAGADDMRARIICHQNRFLSNHITRLMCGPGCPFLSMQI